MLLKSFTVK